MRTAKAFVRFRNCSYTGISAPNYKITRLPTYKIQCASTGTSSTAFLRRGHGQPGVISNSLFDFFTNAIVGIAAASPSGQNVRPSMFSAVLHVIDIFVGAPTVVENENSASFF